MGGALLSTFHIEEVYAHGPPFMVLYEAASESG